MEKVKEYLLEMEAKKQLGEENYNIIKQKFQEKFIEFCHSCSSSELKKKVNSKFENLKALEKTIWNCGLMQVLGGSMIGAAIYSFNTQGMKDTIIAVVFGILITGISTLLKSSKKKEYKEIRESLVSMINEDKNISSDIENSNPDLTKFIHNQFIDEMVG